MASVQKFVSEFVNPIKYSVEIEDDPKEIENSVDPDQMTLHRR